MLARCLEGVLRQTLPAGWRMSVLVVENNEEPSEQLSVSSRQTQPGTELYYFHETTLGISSARNRAVEEALNLNADWIAFIDDDEVPDESWLKELADAAVTMAGDIFRGIVIPCYPENTKYPPPSGWALPKLPEGAELSSAAAGNVMLKASIVASSGLGLRFDTSMGLTGGEDTEFFSRARLKGAMIRYVPKSIAVEYIPPTKASIYYYLSTEARMSSNAAYMKTKRHGPYIGFPKVLYRAMKNCIRGLLGVMATMITGLYKEETKYRQQMVDSLSQIARAYGAMAFLLSFRIQSYRKVHGE